MSGFVNNVIFPRELLNEIFSYYQTPQALVNTGKVCKLFKEVSDSNSLWEKLAQHNFPYSDKILNKDQYQRHYQFRQNLIHEHFTSLQIDNQSAQTITCLAFAKDFLFAGGGENYDGFLKIWKKDKNGHFHTIQYHCLKHTGQMMGMKFEDDQLFTLYRNNRLEIWKENEGSFTSTLFSYGLSDLYSVSLGYCEGMLFRGTDANFTISKKNEAGEFSECQAIRHSALCFAFHEDLIFTGCGYDIIIWKEFEGKFKEIQHLEGHNGRVSNLIFHENALFSGSWDGTVKIWKKNEEGNYEKVDTLNGHASAIFSMSFKEGLLFTSAANRTLRVWGRVGEKYKEIKSLSQPENEIRCLDFFDDLLVTAQKNEVRILDIYKNKISSPASKRAKTESPAD